MRKDTLDILCCPVCKGDLLLKSEKEKGEEVVEGMLICSECEKKYMIKQGIPDLVV